MIALIRPIPTCCFDGALPPGRSPWAVPSGTGGMPRAAGVSNGSVEPRRRIYAIPKDPTADMANRSHIRKSRAGRLRRLCDNGMPAENRRCAGCDIPGEIVDDSYIEATSKKLNQFNAGRDSHLPMQIFSRFLGIMLVDFSQGVAVGRVEFFGQDDLDFSQ
jgi:hypothetical protein